MSTGMPYGIGPFEHTMICGATAPGIVAGIDHEHECRQPARQPARRPEQTEGTMEHKCHLCPMTWTERPGAVRLVLCAPTKPHGAARTSTWAAAALGAIAGAALATVIVTGLLTL